MRIRKRQVPLSFSSLSPLPLSDPLLRRTPPVQLHLQLPSSDPPNLHPYACDSAADHTNNALGKKDQLEQHDSRETTVFGAETSNGVLPLSSSSPQVGDGQWCERDKEFPLKKRRGSFERQSDDDQNNADDQTTTAAAAAATLKNIVTVDKDEKKPPPCPPPPSPSLTLASKKRTKLGLVKARSISSLLGQPDGMAAIPPSPPPSQSTLPNDNINQ
ncbi:uncharacterized protein LOC111481709 isoform X2 [Cucurbita maxima]|uniref:Uncharacterized protein LOC111481709 isoform X2 n=1 Tax=Cucurbita maxima TaxID=3661 RepID=A0A6J1J106_CUCMA|nr:uncharacterized protein LOC111481709 isoform X2 [Cucurbita maxima]